MRRRLLFTTFACCAFFVPPLFAAPGDTKRREEFRALIGWIEKNGVRETLAGGIPETAGANTRRIRVIACSFNEIEANAKHVFCVSVSPKHQEFLFFILMDVGDGTAIVWRVSSRGKLISTMCTAADAVQPVPNTEFAAGFLAEKEYFLRTMRLANLRFRAATPTVDASMP